MEDPCLYLPGCTDGSMAPYSVGIPRQKSVYQLLGINRILETEGTAFVLLAVIYVGRVC